MARASWYRLDNVGKFYSAEASSPRQTVFRFSAELSDAIEPDALQRALDRTVERYPGFNVCLRSGFFWHYLEPIADLPQVQPENVPVCFGLYAGPKSVLFRVSYFRARINLEVSHMISDGRGSLSFFRTLIQSYVQEHYGAPCAPATPADEESGPLYNEDSFSKHYEKRKAGSTPTQRAYRIRGLRDFANPTYMEYHLPANEVLSVAHEMNVSVSSLVIAAVVLALRKTMPDRYTDRPIRLTVPVDLRQFFESDTMRNFFGLATVSYTPRQQLDSLDDIARLVQKQIRDAARPEQLARRMNRMISLEKSPFLRMAPLVLKDLALDFGARVAARDITSAVSSLGRISFGDCTDPYVRNVNLLTSTNDLNFLVCTFGDDLSIGISTIFANLETVREFCRIFSELGIRGHINMNKTDEGVMRDLRSAQIEDTMRQIAETRRKTEAESSHMLRQYTRETI